MHPNSHLHQYLQQPSLAGAANPLTAAALQPGGPNNNMNALSQHFPAMNRNAGANSAADPFVYAQMMSNASQAMPMSTAFAMQPQPQPQHPQPQPQPQPQPEQKLQQLDEEKIYGLVLDLLNPSSREQALLDLSKKREQYEDLALVLWYSYGKVCVCVYVVHVSDIRLGVIPVLLQEIITVYPLLTPPTLSGGASNRVCNALALLQCVANHNETRSLFLQAHIPLYLYPFLNTTSKTRPFEYLRLTSLGVIGALVKVSSAYTLVRIDTDILLVIRMIILKSLVSCCLPKLFLSVFVSWKPEVNFQKQLLFSLFKRSCWTKQA